MINPIIPNFFAVLMIALLSLTANAHNIEQGFKLQKQGNHQDAINLWQEHLAQSDNPDRIRLEMARSYVALGQTETASDLIIEVLKNPNLPTDVRKNIIFYLQNILSPKPNKSEWSTSVFVGADDNANLEAKPSDQFNFYGFQSKISSTKKDHLKQIKQLNSLTTYYKAYSYAGSETPMDSLIVIAKNKFEWPNKIQSEQGFIYVSDDENNTEVFLQWRPSYKQVISKNFRINYAAFFKASTEQKQTNVSAQFGYQKGSWYHYGKLTLGNDQGTGYATAQLLNNYRFNSKWDINGIIEHTSYEEGDNEQQLKFSTHYKLNKNWKITLNGSLQNVNNSVNYQRRRIELNLGYKI